MTTCPKCGYVRQPTDTAPDYECPKCKIIYSKFDPAAEKVRQASIELKRQQAAEAEAQRLEEERQKAEKVLSRNLCQFCGYDLKVGSFVSCPKCKAKLQTCSICKSNPADLYTKEKGFFCNNCKNKLPSGQIRCPVCNTVQEEMAECLNCGASFDKIKIDCPACGEKTPFRAETCSNCGVLFSNIPIKDLPAKELIVDPKRLEEERRAEKVKAQRLEIERQYVKGPLGCTIIFIMTIVLFGGIYYYCENPKKQERA